MQKILVLGGYGGAGSVICRLLLKETDAQVAVAGRRAAKAEALAAALNAEFAARRASAVVADASAPDMLARAFADATLVVDATPSSIPNARTVAEVAIATGVDCLDIHFEQKIYPVLQSLAPRIEEAGRCFVTQAGFHPGLPAAFIRYGASYFDACRSAFIGMAMNQPIETAESIYEIVDVLAEPRVDLVKDGSWRSASVFESRMFDFGARFGRRACYPIQLEELRALPGLLGLQDAGVYVAGFNWFVDNLLFPSAYVLFKIRPGLGRKTVAKLVVWGINTFSGTQRGVSFVLEAAGVNDGKEARLRVVAEHDDVYAFTAIPVVACVRQFLRGDIARPGLWMMGHVVETVTLIADMIQMGVEVRTSFTCPT